MYDAADSILAQKLAQVEGVGQVFVGGSSRPAVRVELNPTLLNKLRHRPGTGSHRAAAANANRAKGDSGRRSACGQSRIPISSSRRQNTSR